MVILPNNPNQLTMKKFFSNPYISSTLTAIVAILATSTKDVLNHAPLFTTLVSIVSIFYNWLVAFLLFKISLWVILIAFAVIIFAVWRYKIYRETKVELYDLLEPIKTSTPKFLNYKRDTFRGYIWSWDYKLVGDKYNIQNIQPYCPDDKSPLMGNLVNFICTECGKHFPLPYSTPNLSYNDKIDAIKLLIKNNVQGKFGNSAIW